jgi:hypothetical protein
VVESNHDTLIDDISRREALDFDEELQSIGDDSTSEKGQESDDDRSNSSEENDE